MPDDYCQHGHQMGPGELLSRYCYVCLWAEIARLRAMLDAARRYVGGGEYHERLEARNDLEAALCTLDSEPCHDCVDGAAPKDGNEGSTRYVCPTCGGTGMTYGNPAEPASVAPCPTCGGSGESWKYMPGTTNEKEPCPTCGGSGRKG